MVTMTALGGVPYYIDLLVANQRYRALRSDE
jgi:hypothetical protein